jgi:cell fate regulator YaaT (PSP1 superfamily)
VPIFPLPQFEADLKQQLVEEDRKAYEALRAPKTLVVRFGSMKLIGEFAYQGQVKPGCGSKLIVKTFRGTELGEMLTSTCPNSGCSKSVSRQEMLTYIDNSGGNDYPFYTEGRVLRIATTDDLREQEKLEQRKHELKVLARTMAARLHIKAKIVEVEPVLGGESVTVFYSIELPADAASPDGHVPHHPSAHHPVAHNAPPGGPLRVEMRDLVRELGQALRTHVEMRAIGARDEARLTADYEKCGQYCCCKNFLKVLRPVSMKSAKVQKATLDPLKISGRCGRLMCCLRYEDNTYDELSKRLPRKKSRVGTPEGDGVVLDSQILTQLVLVLLDRAGDDGKPRQIAVAVEDLSPVQDAKGPTGDMQERIRAAQDAARADRRRPGAAGPSAMGATLSTRPQAPQPASDDDVAEAPDKPTDQRASQPARPEQSREPRPNAAPQQPRSQPNREPNRDANRDAPQPPRMPQAGERPRIHQRGKPAPRGPQAPQAPQAPQSSQPPQARDGKPPAPRPPQPPRPPRSKDDEIDEIMGDLLGGGGGERPRRPGPPGPRRNDRGPDSRGPDSRGPDSRRQDPGRQDPRGPRPPRNRPPQQGGQQDGQQGDGGGDAPPPAGP